MSLKYLQFETFPETIKDENGHTSGIPVTHKVSPDLGFGIVEHDVPCHVCFDAPAVNMTEPCWKCQEVGYVTIKAPKGSVKRLILETLGLIKTR